MQGLFRDAVHEQYSKELLGIYIFYYGHLSDDRITEAVKYPFPGGQIPQNVKEWAKDYTKDARDHSLGHFIQNMQTMVEVSGGKEAWATATAQDRQNILTLSFERCPAAHSSLAFDHENEVVDFEGIFFSIDGEVEPWRNMIRVKWVQLALKTYETMVAKDDRQELEAFWNTVSTCQEIKALNLGGINMVPSRRTPASRLWFGK